MRLAAGDETGYLGREVVPVEQHAKRVPFHAGVHVPGEPQGVDQGVGLDGLAAAAQEPVVHADVVADDDLAVDALGEFGGDLGQRGRRGEDLAGEAG